MERLRTRAMIAGLALIVAGAVIQMSPAATHVTRTEAFLEDKAPLKVGDYVFTPSPTSSKPKQSYDVDESTYEILKPFGVVGRVYDDGDRAFDVMLIASNKKDSFHDQRVCFSASGWTLAEETRETINTSRGSIPYTLVQMTNDTGQRQVAIYFYKGPGGFFAAPQELTKAMFWEQFWGGRDLESVF